VQTELIRPALLICFSMFNYLNVRAGERTVEPFGEAAVLSDVADHGAIASAAARTLQRIERSAAVVNVVQIFKGVGGFIPTCMKTGKGDSSFSDGCAGGLD
jgi:hypothetical protein